MSASNLLSLIENALREKGAPMSARALVADIRAAHGDELRGSTPWKTVGARLAVDIRRNPETKFLRAGRGLYGLREWPDVRETAVPARKINPLDEEILAVPRNAFDKLVGGTHQEGLLEVDFVPILSASQTVQRRVAEETEELVQLIPSFVVLRGHEILSYKRTRRTPENRLHDSRSIVFGGHLQAEDIPTLFSHEKKVVVDFVFRELREELELSPPAQRYFYAGILHLRRSAFERQHAGLVFVLDVPLGATARSLEPGYHSSLEFLSWDEVIRSNVMDDRWSATCVAALKGGKE